MSYVILLRRDGTPEERAGQREALDGARLAADILADPDSPATLMILVGIDEPRDLGLYREGDDFSPPWDMAIRGDFSEQSALRAANKAKAAGGFDRLIVFEVEETRVKPGLDALTGAIEGYHMLHPVFFHEDLPRSALLRSWREIHADLAVKVHVGAAWYSQLLVTRRLGDGPAYDGFSSLHFPSRDALYNGYFDSPRGRAEVRHDIRHFVRGIPPRMFGALTIYRRP
jgi:hypothetical protein